MRQHCDTNVGGLGSDTDDPHIINGLLKDIGDFVPWGSVKPPNPPIPDPDPILPPATYIQVSKWLQQSLNKLGATLDIDGQIGPLSLDAIRKYLT